jgi:dTDP-4-amino-4,6-dideoxygalactose transaminase
MNVPELALTRQYAEIAEELAGAFAQVLSTQRFASGPRVAELEEKLAAYCQVRFAVGVASGTDALLVALLALGVGPGDEVITTPFTFFATAGAVHRVGARPVFVDIRPDTFNLDPELIPAAVTERTRALIPVHLYGQVADMDPLLALAEGRDLPIIEDAAQAVGATYRGRRAGSFGRAACLSFYPTKNLGAYGEAGMLVTSDEGLAERARLLRNHGMTQQYLHYCVGFNSRMDELQAAVLLVKLRRLEAWNQARRERAATYTKLLAEVPEVTAPAVDARCEHIFHQYVIRAPRRDALLEHLRARGVGARVFYPYPLHLQPCFAGLGYREGDFPEAERTAREVLALPLYPELRVDEQEYVVATLAEFYRGSTGSPRPERAEGRG